MSPWAAVELMRQQTCVSCQCHPEGDVSSNGGLTLSLIPPTPTMSHSPPLHSTSSLTITLHCHIASPIKIIKNSPFSCPAHSTLSSLSLLLHHSGFLSLCCTLPPSHRHSSSSSLVVVVSLRGAVLLLLTVCHLEQSEGREWREGEGKPVGERRASTPLLVHCKSIYSTPARVLLSAFCLRSVRSASL